MRSTMATSGALDEKGRPAMYVVDNSPRLPAPPPMESAHARALDSMQALALQPGAVDTLERALRQADATGAGFLSRAEMRRALPRSTVPNSFCGVK